MGLDRRIEERVLLIADFGEDAGDTGTTVFVGAVPSGCRNEELQRESEFRRGRMAVKTAPKFPEPSASWGGGGGRCCRQYA